MNETIVFKNCGERISRSSNICPHCGSSITSVKIDPIEVREEEKTDFNPFGLRRKAYNKWISFFLCLFFGWLGVHKFYEEKFFVGFIYLITGGIFGIGWILDTVTLLLKPNPYYLWK